MPIAEPQKLHWTPDPVWPVPTAAEVRALIANHGEARALELLRESHDRRERAIRAAREEPVFHAYEPETWKESRRLLAQFGELGIMGQNRSGKTRFAAKYCMEKIVTQPNKLAAFFHMTEETSKNQQQKVIYEHLPVAWRKLGADGDSVYVKYSAANGFTNGKFVLPNGGMGLFFNYRQSFDVWEGYEFDVVWCDELVPLPVLETLRYRVGQGRRLEILVTFTPKTGFTPTVQNLLAGGAVTRSLPAPLLPQDQVHVKGCPPGHMPYTIEGKGKSVVFFHWGSNPYGANDEIRSKLEGAPLARVKMRAYGWADKTVEGALTKYDETVHLVPRAKFEAEWAKVGTRYCVADPGMAKNWFIKWYLVTPGGKTIVYREWPDARRFGEWALSPSEAEDGGGRKFDWRVGPAQRVGLLQGINEIKRMILEEEGWRWDYEKQAWDDSRAEKIERRLIDPRLGAEGIPSMDEGTSIIDLMECEGHDGRMVLAPMFWEAAPASHVSEGVGLLNEQMAFDGDRPVAADNCPAWYVVDDLEQTKLAYREYTLAGSQRDALKDIVDPDRYFAKARLGYVSPDMWKPSGGTYY